MYHIDRPVCTHLTIGIHCPATLYLFYSFFSGCHPLEFNLIYADVSCSLVPIRLVTFDTVCLFFFPMRACVCVFVCMQLSFCSVFTLSSKSTIKHSNHLKICWSLQLLIKVLFIYLIFGTKSAQISQ